MVTYVFDENHPKKKIITVNIDSTTSVPAGSYEMTIIQPPKGKIWYFVGGNVRVPAPSDATTGTHLFQLYIGNSYTAYNLFVSNYNSIISYLFGKAFGKSEEFAISNDVYCKISYVNLTDTEQTNKRLIRLIFEEQDKTI